LFSCRRQLGRFPPKNRERGSGEPGSHTFCGRSTGQEQGQVWGPFPGGGGWEIGGEGMLGAWTPLIYLMPLRGPPRCDRRPPPAHEGRPVGRR